MFAIATPLFGLLLAGQRAAVGPRFAAFSVRPAGAQDCAQQRPAEDPTRLMACLPLRFLILEAYGLAESQLKGPEPALSQAFLVQAATAAPSSHDEKMAMLRSALEERFQLQLSSAPTRTALYALRIAPGGPKIAAPGAAPPEPPRPGSQPVWNFKNVAELVQKLNQLQANSQGLANGLDRPVVDETGLAGDVPMSLTLNGVVTPGGGRLLQGNFFPALLEAQLGLRLVPTTAPYSVYTVQNVVVPAGEPLL